MMSETTSIADSTTVLPVAEPTEVLPVVDPVRSPAPEATESGSRPKPAPRRGELQHTVTPDVTDVVEARRRSLRGLRAEDVFNTLGAAAAAIAAGTLLFGWIAPLTGAVSWVVVVFLLFLLFYGVLVSLSAGWQEVKDRVITSLFIAAGLTLVGALIFVVAYALIRGQEALSYFNFFTETMEFAGPLDPLDTGGILHAIIGTIIQIGIALAITVPLGIVTALYLNEVGGKFARFVRTIADAMTALPSIVAGLFIYAAVILLITGQRSGFAAALAITVMMLPIVIRAADVVLRLVAGNLREAAYALGASRWRTVWHVVLPTARSGLVTAVILGTARGIGETSPVLLTSGVTSVVNFNPFEGPMISLPLQVFDFVRSPEPNLIARGFGAAATLMLLVLVLFIVARVFGGRAAGELSSRGQRRAHERSKQDALRMEAAAFYREQRESETPDLIPTDSEDKR